MAAAGDASYENEFREIVYRHVEMIKEVIPAGEEMCIRDRADTVRHLSQSTCVRRPFL